MSPRWFQIHLARPIQPLFVEMGTNHSRSCRTSFPACGRDGTGFTVRLRLYRNLSRWAELYFSRNRSTIERDQTDSLYFLKSDVQRAVIKQEREDNSIQNYVKESTLPYVDVDIKNIILDDLRQSPYSARIEFEKVYTNPADHAELKRERWTASVTCVFRENVKNNELAVNPLGLSIVHFRADQALS
jgi:type IV secretion system protein VirB5